MRRNISTRFHHISAPNQLIEMIDRETIRIQKHYPGICGFKVVVDVPNLRRRRGNQVRALVSVEVGNIGLVVTKEVEGMSERENAVAALDRAFDAAQNRVEHFFHRDRFKHDRKGPSASDSVTRWKVLGGDFSGAEALS